MAQSTTTDASLGDLLAQSGSRLWVPVVVAAMSLFATYLGWQLTEDFTEAHSRAQFVSETQRLETEILDRLAVYEEVVLGGVGLFRASGEVTRDEFRDYVDSLNLERRLPGIQGLGYAEVIQPENLNTHIQSIKGQGFPDYSVRPPGQRSIYTSIVFLEPFDWRNQRAFGYDMFSQPTRREAMERARETGDFAMSGRVELVQETDTDVQAGFLIYHPLYHNDSQPTNEAERRDAHIGYVYGAFRADDLMRGILRDDSSTVRFRIYDQGVLDPQFLLYDGKNTDEFARSTPTFSHSSVVSVAGRDWLIEFSTSAAFNAAFDSYLSTSILVAGIVMSLLLGIIATTLVTTRSRVDIRTNELREQEMLNSHLLENLVDAVVTCDIDGRVTMVNKIARQWFSIDQRDSSEESYLRDFRMFSPQSGKHIIDEELPLARALTGEFMTDDEACLILPGDERLYMTISGGPITNAGGERVGAVIVMKDVTTRRELAEETRQQRRFLRQVIDLSPHLVFAKDPDGRFVLANAALAEAYGVTSEAFIGKTEAEFNPNAGELKILEEEERQVLATGSERVSLETRRFSNLRPERWFNTVRRSVHAPDGNITQVMGVAIDITEQRRSELEIKKLAENLEKRVDERTERLRITNEELEAAKVEAEQASVAKSTFLASMSHEIRTPMNGVVGMVEVLDQSDLDRDQAEAVKTMRESAYSLLNLIDSVLDFSKIEAGALELESTPVDVWDLARMACKSLAQLANHKGVDLTLMISPDAPQWIQSDETRLRQVMCNLIGNAIKFSGNREERRGRVQVRLERDITRADGLAMSVSDNGIGMAPEALATLFDSFTQAESSTTRKYGGSGLGLAISSRIVGLMDGEIDVQSEVGEGSIFRVKVPVDGLSNIEQLEEIDLSDIEIVVVGGEFASEDELQSLIGERNQNITVAESLQDAVDISASKGLTVIIAQDFGRERSELKLTDVMKVSVKASNARVLLLAWGRQFRSTVVDDYVVAYDGSSIDPLTLNHAIAIAAGRASPEDFAETSTVRIKPDTVKNSRTTVGESRRNGSLVLVAEDDSTNQMVILRQLELLGYAAEVANDGEEALAMWQANDYMLLLSDLHMPNMDGYQLAAAIRAEEAEGQHIPIIALTANALQGEVSRAKEAGMDEYLTKPVKLGLLEETLTQWSAVARDKAPPQTTVDEESEQDVVAIADGVLDLDVLRDFVGDDPEAINEVLEDFMLSAQDGAAKLRSFSDVANVGEMKAIAHRLKSSSRAVGAEHLGDICSELENACRANDADAIRKHLGDFESYFPKVAEEVSNSIDAA